MLARVNGTAWMRLANPLGGIAPGSVRRSLAQRATYLGMADAMDNRAHAGLLTES